MENDPVNHPKHYSSPFETAPNECIDITQYLTFCLGNVVKYLWREGSKSPEDNGYQDFKKAIWYFKRHCSLPIAFHFTGHEAIAQAIFYTKFKEPDTETNFELFMRWRLIDFALGESFWIDKKEGEPWVGLMWSAFRDLQAYMVKNGKWPDEELR